MSVTNEEWGLLLEILREGNIDRIFENQKDLLVRRLEEFGRAYERRLHGKPPSDLPQRASIGDVLAEYRRNPHRVSTLLQAIAFLVSPEMLAMMWMVMLGARIEKIEYTYVRAETSHLAVNIILPDLETPISFKSSEHWDAAVLKLAVLSKGDEQPMVEDFHALRLPRPPS